MKRRLPWRSSSQNLSVHFTLALSLWNFRLISFAWDLLLGIFRLVSFTVEGSLAIFGLRSFVWEAPLGNCRLINPACDLSLIIVVWDYSVGNFRLGAFDWELSLVKLRLFFFFGWDLSLRDRE